MKRFVNSDGNRTDYQYDPVGRLTGIWAPNNQLTSFVYDDGGRLAEKWFPNGANTQYSYNADNTLAQLINRHGSGMIISQHDYTYDQVGNRNSHKELIGGLTTPYSYGYDNLNRLISVNGSETYAYDPLGNRRTKTSGGSTLAYVYDNANQLLEIHSGSAGGPLTAGLVYDLNGNLQKKCDGGTVTVSPTNCTGTTVTDITNDFLNRPVQIAKTGIAAQSYKYDDSGRRIQKVNGSTIINYLYNGSQILDQYDNTWGQPTFNYVYGPGADAPTIRANSTGAQFYHQNGIGNAVAVTNQTGLTDGTATYDVYGNLTASTGTIPTYGFTGREPDETGLIFYRARYYDPSIGRFTQRDPIGMLGGTNLYAYAGSNPTNFRDPEGLCPTCIVGAVIGGGGELLTQYVAFKLTSAPGQSFSPNWTNVGISAGAGFVGAGILKGVSNIVQGYSALSQATRVGASVATEVSLGAAQTALRGEEITATKLAAYAAGGLGAGLLGEAVAKNVLGSTAAVVEREADRYLRIAGNRIAEGATAGRINSALDKADDILKSVFDAADLQAAITGGGIGASIATLADVVEDFLGGKSKPTIGAVDNGIQGSTNTVTISPTSGSYAGGGITNGAIDLK